MYDRLRRRVTGLEVDVDAVLFVVDFARTRTHLRAQTPGGLLRRMTRSH